MIFHSYVKLPEGTDGYPMAIPIFLSPPTLLPSCILAFSPGRTCNCSASALQLRWFYLWSLPWESNGTFFGRQQMRHVLNGSGSTFSHDSGNGHHHHVIPPLSHGVRYPIDPGRIRMQKGTPLHSDVNIISSVWRCKSFGPKSKTKERTNELPMTWVVYNLL